MKAMWLDCDPGHDDALAIVLAGFSDNLRVLGISTVAGNQTLEKVTENALRVTSFFGLEDLRVVPGQARPLIRAPIHCPEIHGDSGLEGKTGGHALPETKKKPVEGKAVDVMFRAIERWNKESGSRVYVVATGALTNVALLLIVYPEVKEMIEIVFMGGALGVGNTGPVVEFNIQTDPEACHVILESGCPVTMVPLEVTHTALVTGDVMRRIRSIGNPVFVQTVTELLHFFADTYSKVFKFDMPPLHDPCAVAYVISPDMFESEFLRVDVELASSLTAGQTVVDVWRQSKKKPNVHVCMKMNVPRFWNLMIKSIEQSSTHSLA